MNISILLVLILSVLVLMVPIFKIIYSERDYKKQLSGKRPMRKFIGENVPKDVKDIGPSQTQLENDMYKARMEAELKLKGGQNLLGPM